MKKVGIFYGPAGGRTEEVARKLGEILGSENHDLLAVRDSSADDLEKYENIILGVATIGQETWDADPRHSGWFDFLPELEKADLKGRKIAIFGLGDHVRWPKHFVDAMGQLYEVIRNKGMDTIGKVSPDGYTFDESEALIDGMFIGLPVDEDFEPELTERRINEWLSQISKQFNN